MTAILNKISGLQMISFSNGEAIATVIAIDLTISKPPLKMAAIWVSFQMVGLSSRQMAIKTDHLSTEQAWTIQIRDLSGKWIPTVVCYFY